MSSLNFNTSNQTFRQLLGNGLTYRVPPFQRDYSWTDDEWDDLWQDILGLFEDDGEPAHYMGYLVLQSSNSKEFDIIDGQQRLTTLSLMVLAALGQLKDLVVEGIDADRNQQRKDNLQNSYIGYIDPVSLVPRSKLVLNRHNDKFYQNFLVPLESLPQRNLNASEHLLRKGFSWFKERLKGHCEQRGEDIAAFIDSLVDKLFFTVITVTDELNAFKVFETLNARGVRLSSTDLLKNYLFSVISSAGIHDSELKALEDQWERIVGELGNESFPEFLRIFWNSRHKLVRKPDLFKTIRKRITTREQTFTLLRDLGKAASIYAALRNPHDETWFPDERQHLQQLQMFNTRQPLAMLMACFEQFSEQDRATFSKTLRAITVTAFRYNVICNLQTHEQERTYNDAAVNVSNKTLSSLQTVVGSLKDVYPDDAVFKAAFREKSVRTTNSRNKKIVRFILFQIEKQESGQEFEFESAVYNLEHILPENPSTAWSHIAEHNQDKFVYRLGNMTPLESKANRKIGNASYTEKKSTFASSSFKITRAIPEHYEEWNEAKINARQGQMANLASAIWRIDFND